METKKTIEELKQIAQKVRVDIVSTLAKVGSGHPGGSLSCTDILVALFFNIMNIDPESFDKKGRDHFHLSKGHACPALYSVLARKGFFPVEELSTLRSFGTRLQGHPHPKAPGVEVASGSLGQGLSVACGMALAERMNSSDSRVFTVLGDGELQEGQVWESAMFAVHHKLDNLVVFVDNNGLQIDGKNDEVISLGDLEAKWKSFGFNCILIDGHNIEEIIKAVAAASECKGRPSVVIAKTVKGKGVSFMEHNPGFHGKTPDDEQLAKALEDLKEDK